ncbi:MAG: hydrogenase maturation protease [Coriobacteriales bacterium]|jgi:hydrogenase maturation protease|nr:hydrogenase maturation protease [Coriobacteriales bacterium]
MNNGDTNKRHVAANLPNAQVAAGRVAILCVGNILMLDEGAAPRVAAELLARYEFPENVEVLDRGTMGMALLADLKRFDVILLVDAVDNTGQPPGTVVTYLPEEIAPYEAFHGAHDTRFIDVLEAAALVGYTPEAHCLGVQVQNMLPSEYAIGLTPPVEAAIPFLVECVIGFLNQRNIHPVCHGDVSPDTLNHGDALTH